MNRLVVLGVVVVAALYLLISSIYVVDQRQQAVVMRFGQITDVRTEPGLYFKLPTSLVDTVQVVEKRLLRYDIANVTLQVKGGKFYEVDAFLTYQIADPRKFRERALGNLQLVESRIDTRFDAALRQVYGLREFSAALSAERTEMMKETLDLIHPDMEELGIDVRDVRILRTDLTQQVSSQTFDRMKAERLAEAALLRAGGQQAAQSLRAIADRQSIEIKAAATKDSEILRGQGEAARSQVFAQAYNVDPEFFKFYRSLQAYRTSLASSGTTMVLSPESEFFKFFEDSGAPTVPPGAVVPGVSTTTPVPGPVPASTTSDPASDIKPTAPLDTSNPGANSAPTPAITSTPDVTAPAAGK